MVSNIWSAIFDNMLSKSHVVYINISLVTFAFLQCSTFQTMRIIFKGSHSRQLKIVAHLETEIIDMFPLKLGSSIIIQ